MELEIIKRVTIGIVLTIQSYWDFRYKEIPTFVSIVGGGVGFFICIFEERELAHIMMAFIPGILCFIFCRVSQEAVGYGDAIMFLVLGMFYSLGTILSICMIAYSVAGTISLVLLLFFQKKGNYEIPFIPFLWMGWGVEFLFSLGGIYG